ncbi:MAG: hypothetical protein V1767_01130 [Chloroflexota bacterium]
MEKPKIICPPCGPAPKRRTVHIVIDEKHTLSDGSVVKVDHIGRMYFYSRLFLNPEENPMEHESFTGAGAKERAMAMLEEAIKNDVLEIE